MEVGGAITCEFLQYENTGVSLRLLLDRLKQRHRGLNFTVHEVAAKYRATDLGNLAKRLGGRKHHIDVEVGKESLDISVEAKEIGLGVDLSLQSQKGI